MLLSSSSDVCSLFVIINSLVFYTDSDYNPDPTERYDMPIPKSKEQEFDKRVLINRTRPERCDKIITLYQLVRPKEKEKSYFDMPMSSSCERPFIVVPIPSTNMILLVASTLCAPEINVPFHTPPVQKHYNATSLQCFKLRNSPTYRRHLKQCFNKHQNESEIQLCGNANRFCLCLNNFLTLSIFVIVMKYFI